jgi:20S proteasome subunit beta 3
MQTISTSAPSTAPSVGDKKVNEADDVDSYNSGNPRILLLPNSNTLMAWTGLYGDGLGFSEELSVLLAGKLRRARGMRFGSYSNNHVNDHNNGMSASISRRKEMNPRSTAMLMSHLLYRRRNAPYYVEPVIVGLETVPIDNIDETDDRCQPLISKTARASNVEDSALSIATAAISGQTEKITYELQQRNRRTTRTTIQRPFLCTTDMLGAQSTSHSFVCSGVASRSLHGTAEALWRPNLEGDELVEICGRAFVSALERDCYSGYGAVVYLIQAKGRGDSVDDDGEDEDESDVCIMEYVISCRND